MAATTKSTLSTESPPFNPNRILSRGRHSPTTLYNNVNSNNVNNNNNNNINMLMSSSSFGTSAATTPGQTIGGGIATRAATTATFSGSSLSSSASALGRSRSSSPYPPSMDNPNSNAVPKYIFQDPSTGESLEIRNVWAENVEEEMRYIRDVIERYPYVAMDTEFPGVVAKPVTEAFTSDYHYKSLKVNVDLLKIIQLGLSFADKDGNLCKECPCWQFNFAFDLEGDMYAQDSIDLLINSGISFPDHARRGIDPQAFGELLMVSGLVLDDRVKWVSFHSGYDFAYLLKLLTNQDLPADEKTFFDLLKIYFPTIYDIKYMTSLLDGFFFVGGLQKLADDLNCQRLGAEHQAGSDSLLTMSAYFALVKARFNSPSSSSSAGRADDRRYANELFGYGNNHTVRKGPGRAGGVPPPAGGMMELATSMGSMASVAD